MSLNRAYRVLLQVALLALMLLALAVRRPQKPDLPEASPLPALVLIVSHALRTESRGTQSSCGRHRLACIVSYPSEEQPMGPGNQ